MGQRHFSNASADTIKWRLHRKSDSYNVHLCDTVDIAQTHNSFVTCTDPDASNLTTASHGPDLDLGFKNKISHLSSHVPVVGMPRLFYKQPVLIVSACLLLCQSHSG